MSGSECPSWPHGWSFRVALGTPSSTQITHKSIAPLRLLAAADGWDKPFSIWDDKLGVVRTLMGKASCASLISHGQEQDMLTILTEICPLINLALISDTRENTDESVLVAQLCLTPCDPMNPPGKNTGVGCHALLQGVFPTQESNPGLLHCRWILYHVSHKGSPEKMLS